MVVDVQKIAFTVETMVDDFDDDGDTHKLCLAPITPNNMIMINGAEYSSLRSKRKNPNHIDSLVDELLVEILRRLPSHKTAVMCKAVSKRWAALLSNPFFITRFIADKVHKHNSKIGLLSSTPTSTSTSSKYDEVKINDRKFGVVIRMIGYTNTWIALMVHFNDPIFNPHDVSMYTLPRRSNGGLPRKLTVVGSCNDLLLYCAHADDINYDKIQLFISNIQTKQQWLALPFLPRYNDNYMSAKIGLICDPYYTVVNGNVTLNNACQACVVVFPYTPDYVDKFPAHLLSTNTGGVWRNVVLSLPFRCLLLAFRDDIFCIVGQLLYFLVSVEIDEVYGDVGRLISFNPFDVDNDVIKCSVLSLPDGVVSTTTFFGVFHDQLYMFDRDDDGFYRIWVLEDSKIGQWSLRHNINWCDWIRGDRCRAKLVTQTRFGNPFGFHPVAADIIYVRCDNCIVLCNFSTRKMEFVSKLPKRRRGLSPLFSSKLQITLPVWPTPLPSF